MTRDELIKVAVDYAFASGLVIRSADNPAEAVHAPFSLHPSPFPRQAYEKIVRIQSSFNRLVHAVSQDDAFIEGMMQRFRLFLGLRINSSVLCLVWGMWTIS